MSYGSDQPSGWQPGKNPTIRTKRDNGVLRGWESTSKANQKPSAKKPKPRRRSGGAAPSGPTRDSGYGTKGGANHQAAAGRRSNKSNVDLSSPALGKKHRGPTKVDLGGSNLGRDYKGPRKRPIGNADGSTTAGTSGRSSKTRGSIRGKRFGMGWRAEGAKQGSTVAFNAGAPWNKNRVQKRKEGAAGIHVVKGGDTWASLAKREGTTVAALKKANPWQMKNNKGIMYRNAKIYLPGARKY